MNLKSKTKPVIFCCILFLAASCNNLHVPSLPKLKSGKFNNFTIQIKPFQEMREYSYNDRVIIGLLPLVPFGTIERDSVNELNDGFAENLSRSLKKCGLFEKVYYPVSPLGKVDFIVSGEILSTSLVDRRMTYGVSILAFFTWLFMLPSDIYTQYAVLNIRVADGKTGEILFSKKYMADIYFYEYLYMNRHLPHSKLISALEQKISNQIIEDVLQIGSRP